VNPPSIIIFIQDNIISMIGVSQYRVFKNRMRIQGTVSTPPVVRAFLDKHLPVLR
jgi:hypothetical protein